MRILIAARSLFASYQQHMVQWIRVRRLECASLALGVVIAVAVVAPWFGGRVLLLDFVSGPHQIIVPPTAWGFNGGLTGGLPGDIAQNTLEWLLGAPGSWLLVALIFPIGTGAIGTLVAGSLIRRLGAGLLYTINPFVFDRLYAGDIGLLIGYALLPLVVRALLRLVTNGVRPWSAMLWVGGLIAITVHFSWILVPVSAAIVLTTTPRWQSLRLMVAVGVGAAAMNTYAIVGPLISGSSSTGLASQLAAYQTMSDPNVGLYLNVAGLYGFWRSGPIEPKHVLAGWVAFLGAILLVVAYGYVQALIDPTRRHLAEVSLIAGVFGYFLALGGQGPTGSLYRWAFLHLPGFTMMREPEKFSVLVAFTLACGFGFGVEAIIERMKSKQLAVVGCVVAMGIPVLYTPNLVFGLGGQVAATTYPPSWTAVARLINGRGSALVLPWQEYLPLPFTASRTVANPASDFFSGPVVESENPGSGYGTGGLDPEQRFITYLVANGFRTGQAGILLAQLGVRWVVLVKADGWRSYDWLNHQASLRPALNLSDIEVFKNESSIVSAERVQDLQIVQDLSSLLAIRPSSTAEAITAQIAQSAHVKAVGSSGWWEPTRLVRQSAVSYRIGKGRPGWVVVPIEYQPGWAIDGQSAVPLAAGNMAVRIGSAAATLVYSPFASIFWGEFVSFGVAMTFVIATIVSRVRAKR